MARSYERPKFLECFIALFLFLALGASAFAAEELQKATFAGGCFWCVESAFEDPKRPGISDVVSGYMGGAGKAPTYRDYAEKGHVEVVQITFDPSKISYSGLLDIYWRQIDPTDAGGQFVDRGPQYRSAILYHDEEQKRLAEASKEKLGKSGIYPGPMVTEILAAGDFYEAEATHQNYHNTHPLKYKFYRRASGRDQFLKKIWGEAAEGSKKL